MPASAPVPAPAHRLGGDGEEVGAVHVGLLLLSGQPQPSLVHQRRRLERVPRRLLGHLVGGEATQFLVHERKERFGLPEFARTDRGAESGSRAAFVTVRF